MIKGFLNFDVEYNIHNQKFNKAKNKLSKFNDALRYLDKPSSQISDNIRVLNDQMNKLDGKLNGSKSKAEPGEKDDPTVYDRISIAMRGFFGNTYGPTKSQLKSFEIAKKQWTEIKPSIEKFVKDVNETGILIEESGSPKIMD